MSLVDRIRACQNCDMSKFVPWSIDNQRMGWVRRDVAEKLRGYPTVFSVSDHEIQLMSHLRSFDHRSAALGEVAKALSEAGVFAGWREEAFAIGPSIDAQPVAQLERSAVPVFGVQAYGVHMNGFVRTSKGLKLWVGKRALHRPIEPGKLDNLAAGGIAIGLGVQETLIKECWEEASIAEDLARQAKPVGAIRYRMEHQGWLRNDVMFVYDLELPEGFVPRNQDGEIASFELMSLDQVEDILNRGDEFKFNVALVVIDFLIRHSHLTPERPDYTDLTMGLWRE